MSFKVRGLSVNLRQLKPRPGFDWNLLSLIPQELIRSFDWNSASKYAEIVFIAKTVSKYPWKWSVISLRADLTWNAIRRLDLPWNYSALSSRETIDFDFVRERLYQLEPCCSPSQLRDLPNYPSERETQVAALGLVRGEAAALAVMAAKFFPSYLAWDYARLSESPALPLALVIEAPKLPWSWDDLYHREEYTMEFADRHALPYDPLQCLQEFEPSDYDEHPGIVWNLDSVARLVDQKFVENHPGLLDLRQLSNARWDLTGLFEANPYGSWNFQRLSGNPHLKTRHLALNWSADWDWSQLTSFVSLREIVDTFRQGLWAVADRRAVGRRAVDNPGASVAFFWDLQTLCTRPDMDRYHFLEMVEREPDYWPWATISRAPWFHESILYQVPKAGWDFAAILKSKELSDPNYLIKTFADQLEHVNLKYWTRRVDAELVMDLSFLQWDWDYVAEHYVLTPQDVEQLGDKLKPELVLLNPNYIYDVASTNASEVNDIAQMLDQM